MPNGLPDPDHARDPAGPPERSDPADPAPIVLRSLHWSAPLRWLLLGWRDFVRAPSIGLFFGGCFVIMGWALLWVYQHAPAYTLALSGGFLLVGPFLCLGLYRVSQRLEQGLRPEFGDALRAWDTRSGQLAIFGLVLLVLELLWGRATLVVFAVSFDRLPQFRPSLWSLLEPDMLPFLATWAAVGAVFAGLIYSLSVISIPMILHRRTDAITAALTSARLVLSQTGVMLFWGALITLLVVLALLPGLLGLLVVGPVLGHASWHAYRAAVAD